ncbi:hypothetical protein CIB48_g4999 [Xylaria polymorpha]|nr:hypothetical protein CIB48_g4999 [Xylaria polymorpha]
MAAVAPQPKSTNPFATSYSSPKDNTKDEWEDWEVDSDDSASTSDADGILIDLSGNNSEDKTRKSYKPAGSRFTQRRSVQLHRVKSRARQKAQNAKAGITLVTDMSLFHQAGAVPNANKGRFANTPALRALEGNSSSPSIGSFAWLKPKPGNTLGSKKSMMLTAEDHSADLSPNARPIVIGISVPSDDLGSHQVSPQTAIIETPMDMRSFSHKAGGKAPTPQQVRSIWSPDTEVSDSPQSSRRAVSSIYSQYNPFEVAKMASDAPPVPELPATMKFNQIGGQRDRGDEDGGTPCTLFEEDSSPVARRKSQKQKPNPITVTPGSASSRAHGWWDHVMTPFTPQSNNPFKTQQQQTGSSSTATPHEWWSGQDEKAGSSYRTSHLTINIPTNQGQRGASEQSHSEKAHILLEDSRSNLSNDAPPPYEYPKTQSDAKVAFSQPYANSLPIPSPGPITPGLAATMTSQGGINLADIPLTPSGNRGPIYEARGKSNKTERQRRRHEKEDVMARKVGGFWRGRGCIPEEGCFGRTGREGRKRRRICLGVFGGIIAAIILIAVLVVVLTKRAMSPAVGTGVGTGAGADTGADTGSGHHGTHVEPNLTFLNLTDFPPMPTGVLTVAGPNNSVAVSGCFTDKTPSTAWSCALPKEDHDSVSPYSPNQPEFIFQIQFDNNSRALWKLADEAEQPKNDRRSFTTDAGFEPNPAPPSLEEMRFLGNTTDSIKSDRKEGEPTPFFISLLRAIDETVGPNVLTRRQGNAIPGSSGNGTQGFNFSDILPPPELNPDGTGAPARLFPLPVQQPVRLFDRDLPTEHYGFYTYFDKKIYMVNSQGRDPADEDGGVAHRGRELARDVRADALPRQDLDADGQHDAAAEFRRSRGEPHRYASNKIDFAYAVLRNGEINTANATGVVADLAFKGTLVNGRNNHATLSLGGVDGGTGGCKCEWVNFEQS